MSETEKRCSDCKHVNGYYCELRVLRLNAIEYVTGERQFTEDMPDPCYEYDAFESRSP